MIQSTSLFFDRSSFLNFTEPFDQVYKTLFDGLGKRLFTGTVTLWETFAWETSCYVVILQIEGQHPLSERILKEMFKEHPAGFRGTSRMRRSKPDIQHPDTHFRGIFVVRNGRITKLTMDQTASIVWNSAYYSNHSKPGSPLEKQLCETFYIGLLQLGFTGRISMFSWEAETLGCYITAFQITGHQQLTSHTIANILKDYSEGICDGLDVANFKGIVPADCIIQDRVSIKNGMIQRPRVSKHTASARDTITASKQRDGDSKSATRTTRAKRLSLRRQKSKAIMT